MKKLNEKYNLKIYIYDKCLMFLRPIPRFLFLFYKKNLLGGIITCGFSFSFCGGPSGKKIEYLLFKIIDILFVIK